MSEYRPSTSGPAEAAASDDRPATAPVVAPVPPPPQTAAPVFIAPVPGLATGVRRWAWRAAKLLLVALGAYAGVILIAIFTYRWIDPPTSTVMLGQRLTGTEIIQAWVPLSRVSPALVRAVITSEDSGFCRHHGVDWRELEAAIEQTQEGAPRGGSTIPMQVSKNLFLWSSRSYLRKALEIPITLGADLVWSKPRMLEIYLNIAEWGPGIFGAEAAAQYHFGKSAARLTETEAALLAVALPNPAQRIAGAPSALQVRLAQRLLVRMRSVGDRAACVLGKGT